MRMLVQFQKTDTVRHLGLLDLQRTMQRALRRSGLPVRYSSGFNPHIVMSFASALSTGVPGDAELLDVSLCAETTQEACFEAMNRVLPPTLPVTRVRLVEDGFPKLGAALEQAEYRLRLHGGDCGKIAEQIGAFLAQEEIMALRKTKRQEILVNIRPMIHELTGDYDEKTNELLLTARVSFVEAATLKPEVLLGALTSFAKAEPAGSEIRRTRLLAVRDGHPVELIDL